MRTLLGHLVIKSEVTNESRFPDPLNLDLDFEGSKAR
jgi:hypothetical protein